LDYSEEKDRGYKKLCKKYLIEHIYLNSLIYFYKFGTVICKINHPRPRIQERFFSTKSVVTSKYVKRIIFISRREV